MQTRPSLNRRLSLLGALTLAVVATVQAEEWMEVKDLKGRKLTMKVEKVDGEDVTFTTKAGKTFTYKIAKFSVVDQLALRKWKPPIGSDSPVEEDAKLTPGEATEAGKIYKTKHFEFEAVGGVTQAQLEAVTSHFEAVHWAFPATPLTVSAQTEGLALQGEAL